MTHHYYNATCVSIDGMGVLIEGAPKSGKSSLALSLIEEGAKLVSDDLTFLSLQNQKIYTQVPERLAGFIHVRELGLINLKSYETNSVEVKVLIRLTKNPDEFSGQNKVSLFGVEIAVFNFYVYDFALTTKLKAVIKLLKNEWSFVEKI